MKKIIYLIALAFTGIALLTPAHVQAAPTGLYLDPSGGTYQKDASFAVQLRMNAGSNSGVQANLDFDASKLQVTSVSTQGSALANVTSAHDNSAGDVSVYSVSSSSSGDRLIATINFKAIAPGAAAVDFARTNQTLRYLLLVPVWTSIATTNASYAIAGSTTPPPTSGGGTAPSNPGNSHSSAPRSTTIPKPAPSSINPQNTTPTTQDPATSMEDTPSEDITTTPDKTPVPDFKTTQPDTEPWESSQESAKGSALVPWLPFIVTLVSILTVTGIFIAYRRTHLSHSLRRLIATILSLGATKDAARQAATTSPTASLPLLASVVPRLLLGFKQPKLLASGIKQKLLGSGKSDKH